MSDFENEMKINDKMTQQQKVFSTEVDEKTELLKELERENKRVYNSVNDINHQKHKIEDDNHN